MTGPAWLFVPAGDDRKMSKLDGLDADALILDLEDAVAPSAKARARSVVAGIAPSAQLWVRINPGGTPWHEEDVAMAGRHGHRNLVLPKGTPDAVATLAARLPGARLLVIATETPASVLALGDYSAVARHLAGLAWGGEDLAAYLGARSNREPGGAYTSPYRMVRDMTLIAAKAAGVPALDAVHTDFRDLDACAREARDAARDGFGGKLCIYPAQVPAVRRAFAPSESELDWARRVCNAFAGDDGTGVVALDGRMLDRPHLVAAQTLLAHGAST